MRYSILFNLRSTHIHIRQVAGFHQDLKGQEVNFIPVLKAVENLTTQATEDLAFRMITMILASFNCQAIWRLHMTNLINTALARHR